MNKLDEQIKAVAERGCGGKGCLGCQLKNERDENTNCVDIIARRFVELLREREANPGVWDKAPENATQVKMMFEETHENGYTQGIAMLGYTRTPPKDATRLMAERIRDALADRRLDEPIADIIERELRKE